MGPGVQRIGILGFVVGLIGLALCGCASAKAEPRNVAVPAPLENSSTSPSQKIIAAKSLTSQYPRHNRPAIQDVGGPGGFVQEGKAAWYGKKFHGRKTANGERFDMYARSGAHKTLPFNTRVKVTNLENGKTIIVRINDRGPFSRGFVIDLSYAAAKELDLIRNGDTEVRLEALNEFEDRFEGQRVLGAGEGEMALTVMKRLEQEH